MSGLQPVVLASASVETTLLVLKLAFLVLLYLFIWRIVRSATRDLRAPQESLVLGPREAAAAGLVPAARREPARLVVVRSPSYGTGEEFGLNSMPLVAGRSPGSEIVLTADEYASSRHAKFDPRPDGVWVEDIGSTNGTFVNGIRLTRERRLAPGDVVRIGETDLRFES